MSALLVYSNLAFLLPAFRALARGLFTRFMFDVVVPFTSGGYHACRTSGTRCIFGISYPTFHAADFVVAQMAIPLTALYFIYWKSYAWLQHILILTFLLVMIFMVVQGGDTFTAQALITAVSVGIVVIYWIGYALTSYWDTGKSAFPRYDWGALVAGIVFMGIAIGLFQMQNRVSTRYYWDIHSAWHFCAAIGQWYMWAIKPPDKHAFYRVLDAKMPSA